MRSEEYTPENICRCLGLPGFDSDPVLTSSSRVMRLLLQPSFHPEVCLTIADSAEEITVSIVAAHTMIWRKFELGPVMTHREEVCTDTHRFAPLFEELVSVAKQSGNASYVVIDGMPTDGVLYQNTQKTLAFESNLGVRDHLGKATGPLITALWEQTRSGQCKNALAMIGGYLGLKLPEVKAEEKVPVGTMVLGRDEDREELMQALRHVTRNR